MRNARWTVLAALLLAAAGARAENKKEPFQPTPLARYEGKAKLHGEKVTVVVRDWIIHNERRGGKVPEEGVLGGGVRGGGNPTTIIGGQGGGRKEGGAWGGAQGQGV